MKDAFSKKSKFEYFRSSPNSNWSFAGYRDYLKARCKPEPRDATIRSRYNECLNEASMFKNITATDQSKFKQLLEEWTNKDKTEKPSGHQTIFNNYGIVGAQGESSSGFFSIQASGQSKRSHDAVDGDDGSGSDDVESDNESTVISDDDIEALEELNSEDTFTQAYTAGPSNSFDSEDAHPFREYQLVYLKGDGQENWSRADGSVPEANEVSELKEELDTYRKKSLVGAKHHKQLNDNRILSLSFIFPFVHGRKENDLCDYLESAVCKDTCYSIDIPKYEGSSAIVNYLNDIQEYDVDEVSFDSIIHPIAQKILFNFNNHLKQWITSGTMTENQFAEQAVFPLVSPLFEFKKEYELSKYDKTMITSSLKPDFLVHLNTSKSKQIDFFIVEIKKPSGNVFNQYESDFIKVHREMKQIIDAQIELGIHDPVSYSLLVEGYDIYLYVMKLDYDGEYRTSLINKCRTIRDRDDLLLLSRSINLMIYLNVLLLDLKDKILSHKKTDQSIKSRYRRPSYAKASKKEVKQKVSKNVKKSRA